MAPLILLHLLVEKFHGNNVQCARYDHHTRANHEKHGYAEIEEHHRRSYHLSTPLPIRSFRTCTVKSQQVAVVGYMHGLLACVHRPSRIYYRTSMTPHDEQKNLATLSRCFMTRETTW